MTETHTCRECNSSFEITDEDFGFYEKFEVPPPAACPDCRLMRRLLERNAKHLYYRTCDSTGEKTLSQYHKDQPFPVYSPAAWWSDKWEALDYGRDFDFSRGFFEQFRELKNTVPHCALFNTESTNTNSDFNNCTAYLKNCYLVAETDHCEECYFGNLLKHCRTCVDCSIGFDNEVCYECVDCNNCYNLQYSQDCQTCKDGYFLKNCIGCGDCIGCINQRHKKYMILNKQYSREEYEKLKAEFGLDSHDGITALREKVQEFFGTQPHKYVIAEQNQNSVGDHLYNSKNSYFCFDSKDLEDCRYCAKLSLGVKSSMDYNSWGNKSELMYQCSGCGDNCYGLKFCAMCQSNVKNCEYSYELFSCSDCFGCVSLKNKKFCILNKQYTREGYEVLRAQIIEHMGGEPASAKRGHGPSAQASGFPEAGAYKSKRAGERGSGFAGPSDAELKNKEYGEFFPIEVGAFAYNESIAMDAFPLTREQATAKGYRWLDENSGENSGNSDNIEVFKCGCGKKYRLIPQELKFYKQFAIPMPAKCPACRHGARLALRNPLKLWTRKCQRCATGIQTGYAPDRQEIIFCEKCYLEEAY